MLCPRFAHQGKGKAIPLQARTDPQGCRRLRPTESLGSRHVKAIWLSVFILQKISLVLTCVWGYVSRTAIVQPEGLSQWKITITSSGIEPTTLLLLAQCLNQLRHTLLVRTNSKGREYLWIGWNTAPCAKVCSGIGREILCCWWLLLTLTVSRLLEHYVLTFSCISA